MDRVTLPASRSNVVDQPASDAYPRFPRFEAPVCATAPLEAIMGRKKEGGASKM